MNKIFNCCHGMFDPNQGQGHWICSTRGDGGRVDEEIIGGEAAVSKGGDPNSKLASGARAAPRSRGGPPVPVGSPGAPEDEKENAKQRLQQLIRDFAKEAVGPGLAVEAQCQSLSSVLAECSGTLEAKVRMDRKLSRLELWSLGSAEGGQEKGEQCLMKVPLQQVKQITKRSSSEPGDVTEADGAAGGARAEASSKAESPASKDQQTKGPANTSTRSNNATLCITRRPTTSSQLPDLRLTFESVVVRDRAYTCLRIFQMSVDQSAEGQSREAESDATGYESSATPTAG
mmetsp:Transcript_8504/g.23909  ORF Transcript_8504/g.23909 Transcript_8504/m.23909 type:complete len:288 (+) Transcript_8504:136-999(+)